MEQINFNVSARSIILLGRENISNPYGAIIELVKNSYDADSDFCLIYFDLNNDTLFIIDNGCGMSGETLREYWMQIATNNKEINFKTSNGRIKSGSKGIGRFALDRLGNHTEMYTFTKENPGKGIYWEVNWDDFEKEKINITDVKANYSIINGDIKSRLNDLSKNFLPHLDKINIEHGTIIKISKLRDVWNIENIEGILSSSLSNLVPPDSKYKFQILLNTNIQDFGVVNNSPFNDYDYKVNCKFDGKKFNFSFVRDEFNQVEFPFEIFDKYEDLKIESQFNKENFQAKKFNYEKEIFDFSKEKYSEDDIKKVGSFEFEFYFLKKRLGGEEDKLKYPYKSFDPSNRSQWLDQFSGIRIYRDNFKVRPYGESSGNWDWLDLGNRAAKSPAAISRKGGWRIKPDNISGFINISRVENENILDKSSREGLIENDTYSIFKEMLLFIIKEFEYDRSVFFSCLNNHYVPPVSDQIQERIETVIRKGKTSKGVKPYQDYSKEELISLVDDSLRVYEDSKNKGEKKDEEIKLINSLASKGIIFNCLSHEISENKNDLLRNLNFLSQIINNKFNKSDFDKGTQNFKNPFIQISEAKSRFDKIIYWIEFAFSSIKKDRRKNEKHSINEYFSEIEKSWYGLFEKKEIKLLTNIDDDLFYKFLPIDFDTIFQNLFINSIEAFTRKGHSGKREIKIEVHANDNGFIISYNDNGPGLHESIKRDNDIFEPFFTTNNDRGTGLGMWLVINTVHYYKGDIKITKTKGGFGIEMVFKNNL